MARPHPVPIKVGMQYGHLTIIREVSPCYYPSGRKGRHILCACECGGESVVTLNNLKSGNTTSCGCFQKSLSSKHNMSQSLTYVTWEQMISRCEYSENKGYYLYGARGISVCPRWRNSFLAFYEDMGPRPSPNHSIDRLDGSGNYEPGNCRWATPTEQARNTCRNVMLTYNHNTFCIAEWAERLGVPAKRLYSRLSRGWSVEGALTGKYLSRRQ